MIRFHSLLGFKMLNGIWYDVTLSQNWEKRYWVIGLTISNNIIIDCVNLIVKSSGETKSTIYTYFFLSHLPSSPSCQVQITETTMYCQGYTI